MPHYLYQWKWNGGFHGFTAFPQHQYLRAIRQIPRNRQAPIHSRPFWLPLTHTVSA